MKKLLRFITIIFIISACQKTATPPDAMPATPPADTVATVDTLPKKPSVGSLICTPFAQRINMEIDKYHFDSAYLQLPCAYKAEIKTEKYPLLIFLNGVFEGAKYGGLWKMNKLGPPKYMLDSLRYSFTVNGKTENLIVVCPQSDNGFRRPSSTNKVIDYMIAHYNIDTTRIYLTGLSAGANSVLRYLTENPAYTQRIAAAVPMSTTHLDSTHRANLHYISDAHLPLYWYCGSLDTRYLPINKVYVKKLEELEPGLVTFKLYKGEHKGWNPMYNVTHRQYNPNMYDWLLQHHK